MGKVQDSSKECRAYFREICLQLKTAAEFAQMIELDFASHPDSPQEGFRVTVYGGTHWRAMLTITPAAGGLRNPKEWRDLTNDLAERLRKGYDLV